MPTQTKVLTADDKLAIQELIARYSMYEDTGDADAMAALFTEDGCTVNSRGAVIRGREQLAEAARRRWEKPEVHRWVHWSANVVVEATDDGAEAHSYAMILVIGDDPEDIRVRSLTAKRDRLRREGGRWLFASREVVPLAAG